MCKRPGQPEEDQIQNKFYSYTRVGRDQILQQAWTKSNPKGRAWTGAKDWCQETHNSLKREVVLGNPVEVNIRRSREAGRIMEACETTQPLQKTDPRVLVAFLRQGIQMDLALRPRANVEPKSQK